MKIKGYVLIAGLVIQSVSFAADTASKKPAYRLQNIAHLSCKQAWEQADKSVDKAFGMIETMTVYLLKQRGQAFPNTKENGQLFGQGIDTRCRSDPDQLMLAAVDAALRDVMK